MVTVTCSLTEGLVFNGITFSFIFIASSFCTVFLFYIPFSFTTFFFSRILFLQQEMELEHGNGKNQWKQ